MTSRPPSLRSPPGLCLGPGGPGGAAPGGRPRPAPKPWPTAPGSGSGTATAGSPSTAGTRRKWPFGRDPGLGPAPDRAGGAAGGPDLDIEALFQQPRLSLALGPAPSPWCRMTLNVPHRLLGQFRTTNGPIAVEAVAGFVHCETINGDITLSGIAGEVLAETSNGNVEARGLHARIRGGTANGRIVLEDVDGQVKMETTNGFITGQQPGRLGRGDRPGQHQRRHRPGTGPGHRRDPGGDRPRQHPHPGAPRPGAGGGQAPGPGEGARPRPEDPPGLHQRQHPGAVAPTDLTVGCAASSPPGPLRPARGGGRGPERAAPAGVRRQPGQRHQGHGGGAAGLRRGACAGCSSRAAGPAPAACRRWRRTCWPGPCSAGRCRPAWTRAGAAPGAGRRGLRSPAPGPPGPGAAAQGSPRRAPRTGLARALEGNAMAALESWGRAGNLGRPGRPGRHRAGTWRSRRTSWHGLDLPAASLPGWCQIKAARLRRLPMGRFPRERDRLIREIEKGRRPARPPSRCCWPRPCPARPYALRRNSTSTRVMFSGDAASLA